MVEVGLQHTMKLQEPNSASSEYRVAARRWEPRFWISKVEASRLTGALLSTMNHSCMGCSDRWPLGLVKPPPQQLDCHLGP